MGFVKGVGRLLIAFGFGLTLAAAPMSPATQALVTAAFADLDPAQPVVDFHVHLVGTPEGGHGCEVNPKLLSPWHPFKRMAAQLYLRAGGGRELAGFDQAYVTRLLSLVKGFPRPVKVHLLAMDHHYGPSGNIDRAHTEFFVPNAWVVELSKQHPECFVPVISVHPYRADALVELERWAAQGVRQVKWLPNAQGIDPADPRCESFYLKMKALDMVLLTHAGEERAVSAEGAQGYGNPLKLRRALDLGLTVVVAHCASLGRNEDLDHPGTRASNFDLFLRLMREDRYKGRLFGDLSAMTQFNRLPKPILELLRHPELQGRLVNGSDYPLPAINCVVWTTKLQRLGLITRAERQALNELFRENPLLFDFVLKRTLRDPQGGGSLAARCFTQLPGGVQR